MRALSRLFLKSQAPLGMKYASDAEIQSLTDFISLGTTAVISGAGISTESGLSDYRSPGRTLRRKPIQNQEFLESPQVRQRYWARSFVGFEIYKFVKPGKSHLALAALHKRLGHVREHITQNVDGLLQEACLPSSSLLELHGTVHQVHCLGCGFQMSRNELQRCFQRENEGWSVEFAKKTGAAVGYLPDGDARLDDELVKEFRTPSCPDCGGILMPKLVFFGGAVPTQVTLAARRIVDSVDHVLIVGSSLSTYSAYGLVKRVKSKGGKVAIINFGSTRADPLCDVKLEVDVGDALERLSLCALQNASNASGTVVDRLKVADGQERFQ